MIRSTRGVNHSKKCFAKVLDFQQQARFIVIDIVELELRLQILKSFCYILDYCSRNLQLDTIIEQCVISNLFESMPKVSECFLIFQNLFETS